MSTHLKNLLNWSKQLLERAIREYQPRKIVVMFSGGDDSLTAYHVLKELGYKPDYVIHGYTGTGVAETFQFVKSEVERQQDSFLVADAGTKYEEKVLEHGFYGYGLKSHSRTYHDLKDKPFTHTLSTIRKRRRNYPILLINGARRQESPRREKTMANPVKEMTKTNIWVNIINEWTDDDCKAYLKDRHVQRNPVSVELCHSCECMCGTMHTNAMRQEASFLFPDWGKWIDKLETEVLKRFPWGWNKNAPDRYHREKDGQMTLPGFQPMCTDCKRIFEDDQ